MLQKIWRTKQSFQAAIPIPFHSTNQMYPARTLFHSPSSKPLIATHSIPRDPTLANPSPIEPDDARSASTARFAREKWRRGRYRLGGGEDGGEAEGLFEEHVAGALHLAASFFFRNDPCLH
jgi:hypothetical protein